MGRSFKKVPWEEFARLYYRNFKSDQGVPTKDARLVLGVIIIKHIMKTDDRGVIEMIRKNLYMQYFLGLEALTYEQVMTPSLLVSIRKRKYGLNDINTNYPKPRRLDWGYYFRKEHNETEKYKLLSSQGTNKILYLTGN